MVVVYGNCFSRDIGHGHRDLVALVVDNPDDLVTLEALDVGHELHGDFRHKLFVILPERFPVLDSKGLLLALFHLANLALETFEYQVSPYFELQRIVLCHLIVDLAVW